MKLSDAEIRELRRKYHYLVNYEGDDPCSPIDPLTYVDSNGDTLLHIAARLGGSETVAMLLRAGLDVDRVGDMGCTALHYAKMKKQGKRLKDDADEQRLTADIIELARSYVWAGFEVKPSL